MQLHAIPGDQLFCVQTYGPPPGSHAFLAEDHELCTRFRYHKHKIILFLAAMRSHRDVLESHGVKVRYVSLDENDTRTYEEKLIAHAKSIGATAISLFEVEDAFLESRLTEACKQEGLALSFRRSPAFVTSRSEFESYLSSVSKPFMKTFYEKQRRNLHILMNADGTPVGGRFSFDEENRLKLPAGLVPPMPPTVRHGEHVRQVSRLVDSHFGNHPGQSEDFWLPTTRVGAKAWFEAFLHSRFEHFGPYEDALGPHPFVFHGVLSPLMNLGLLTPGEVLEDALSFASAKGTPLSSLEGFVRQIAGWREFVRGIYRNFGEMEESSNAFAQKAKLSQAWYKGNTGIAPLDEVLAKVFHRGYAHHIERLMVLGNIMLLAGVHPKEAYRWFMEMFVDSADWVMGPNVYGMSQMSDGGLFATKPYVCGSNYLLKMGPWKRGSWCDALDGLYWGFVERNRAFYAKNPRMSMILGTLDRIAPERRQALALASQAARNMLTTQN